MMTKEKCTSFTRKEKWLITLFAIISFLLFSLPVIPKTLTKVTRINLIDGTQMTILGYIVSALLFGGFIKLCLH